MTFRRRLALTAAWLATLGISAAGCSATVTSGDAGADGARPTDTSPPLASALPDGTWSGTLARTCSDGTTATVRCETRIAANVQQTECESGGFVATSLDRYTFTAADAAIWHDLQGGELGRCVVMGASFTCRVTAPGAPVLVRRTMSFAADALDWTDETTAEGVTCTRRGTLRAP